MKIIHALEVIAGVGCGLGLARAAFRASLGVMTPAVDVVSFSRECSAEFGPIFLGGIAVVGMIGLAVEAARGRSPARWGVGRWAWSVSGLFAIVSGIQGAMVLRAQGGLDGLNLSERFGMTWRALGPLLVALWLTARAARVPAAVTHDDREWTGRVLAGTILAWSLFEIADAWWS